MNLLYYSVHQVLEYDEVRLFQGLGINVCSLGCYSPGEALQGYREKIDFNAEEIRLYSVLESSGGSFDFHSHRCRLTEEFVGQFDWVVVMHDLSFIKSNWQLLRKRRVIWRTIGQGVDAYEQTAKGLRLEGMLIVRYSPVEAKITDGAGQNAIIRFGKPKSERAWNGGNKSVLTFSNLYEQRYPFEAADYREIVQGLPAMLGGSGNDDFKNSIGSVDSLTQRCLYSDCRVYLYASGLEIPYTLNFIEAWIAGLPVVVYCPSGRRGRWFEISDLIEHGKTGFVCETIADTRDAIRSLLEDDELAAEVSRNGAIQAHHLFGSDNISAQWLSLLTSSLGIGGARDVFSVGQRSDAGYPTMQLKSFEVFKALQMLRPFDISLDQIHIGNERDGGYVLVDTALDGNVMSFGVGPDISFEIDLARRGATARLHDHTVDALPASHPNCTFVKKGVGGLDQLSNDLDTLHTLTDIAFPFQKNLILKMDVEGSEWDVFSTVEDNTLSKFDQIAMEIHWLENLSDTNYRTKFTEALRRINRQFTLHNVHANNCAPLAFVEGFPVASVLEVSFIRTSLIVRKRSTRIFPSVLNKGNNYKHPDHPLFFYPFLPLSIDDGALMSTAYNLNR